MLVISFILNSIKKDHRLKDSPVFKAEKATKNNPFKILVFTMLSARTKDETTIKVVNSLFQIADTPEKILKLGPEKLEKMLYGVGFFRVKTKHLISICKILSKQKFPNKLEKILELPGVGRKTANIVLARVFNQNTLGVDVHVHRISNRLGLVRTKKPEYTEIELLKILPKKEIRTFNKTIVAFGQTICTPRNPNCLHCPLNEKCPKIGL